MRAPRAVSRLAESMLDSASGIALPTEGLNEVTRARTLATNTIGSTEEELLPCSIRAQNAGGGHLSPMCVDFKLHGTPGLSKSHRLLSRMAQQR